MEMTLTCIKQSTVKNSYKIIKLLKNYVKISVTNSKKTKNKYKKKILKIQNYFKEKFKVDYQENALGDKSWEVLYIDLELTQ